MAARIKHPLVLIMAFFIPVMAHAASLSVSTSGSGTVSGNNIECPSTCFAYYDDGTVITLNAYPASGWKFDGWSGSVGSIENPIMVNMNGDMTIVATFSQLPLIEYTITATAGFGGSISPQGIVSVTQGVSQTFNITSDRGYHIEDVLVDGISVGAVSNYTFFDVTAYHSISASFAADLNTFTITASAETGGNIAPSGNVNVTQGGSQTFNITSDRGYHIGDVLVDGISVSAVSSYTFFDIAANHTISASFAADLNTFTITATAGTGGNITPSGNVSVTQGNNRTFNITSDRGYHIEDVLVDGVSVGAVSRYIFSEVTSDHTISTTFTVNTTNIYTITGTAGAGGSVSPAGDVSVTQGSSQTFTITPDSGYHVADVLVDGISVGTIQSYTFANVVANHTIKASFVSVTGNYTLKIVTSGEGTVVTDPQGSKFQAGTQVNLLAAPSNGWAFDGWGGDISGLENPVTLTMDADKTINATFLNDQDIDGESNSEEQGPDGNDPAYDGNKDGIPDWQQANVVSMHTYDRKYYITIATPEGTNIFDATVSELPKGAPSGYTCSYGLIRFGVSGINPGGSAKVEIILPQGETCTTYYKYDTTSGSWSDFFFDHDTLTGAEINGNVITLNFTDGLRGDQDGTANGIIMDPGTLAVKHQSKSWYQRCFISAADPPDYAWLVILFFSLLMMRGYRRQRQCQGKK
jgi:hypothetical protein